MLQCRSNPCIRNTKLRHHFCNSIQYPHYFVLGAKVGKAWILTDARTGRWYHTLWYTHQAAQASNLPMGVVQPTIVSEWLVWITFERFDEIPSAKVLSASILTDARIGRWFPIIWCSQQAAEPSNDAHVAEHGIELGLQDKFIATYQIYCFLKQFNCFGQIRREILIRGVVIPNNWHGSCTTILLWINKGNVN
jgi:hypothetical protein